MVLVVARVAIGFADLLLLLLGLLHLLLALTKLQHSVLPRVDAHLSGHTDGTALS